jgi:dTDP-4-dehydrorhamnose reductase
VRLLVTGGSGLLGSDLIPVAQARGHEVIAPSSTDFDVTNPAAAAQLGAGELGRFDWVINLAGYTNVDAAETHVQEATELNVIAPGYLGQACSMLGARFLHISTDYVFGGIGHGPYSEDDEVSPVQKYGQTKEEGERSALANGSSIVARVAWLFGKTKRCFPVGMVEACREGKELKIVTDQRGTPSYTPEASRMLLDLIQAEPEPGIYHVAGPVGVSRMEYAEIVRQAYFKATGITPAPLIPVLSSEFFTAAVRPADSVLKTDKVLRYTQAHMPLPDAMDALLVELLGS